ncbi:Fic family protein [Aeromicrobium sp. CTD01-1L150]|uniref:Fic family protein n=1 Tax=Aeromicrobium sp. CTD01-1L150 TaxID=3341830 RepID=UPI0035C19250
MNRSQVRSDQSTSGRFGQPDWPAVTMVERPWHTNPDQRGRNGTRPPLADRHLKSISVEVPPHIADLPVQLAPETVAACEQAAVAVATLDAHGSTFSGVSDVLVRTEAVASSKIERVHADLDDVARASLGHDAGIAAQSTLAATAAVRQLVESAEAGQVTEQAIRDAQHRLLADDLLEAGSAGRYRQVQNWIGGSDFNPLRAVHVPPPADEVPDLMADLVRFANRNDLPAVAQAGIVHAQFEAIHPFTDGNGRVGRALLGAVLRRRRVASNITVPIAAVMLSDVDTYFEHLTAFRSGDAAGFVRYTASAAITAAEAAEVTAARLAAMPASWQDRVGTRRGSSARALIEGLLTTPVLDLGVAKSITRSAPGRTLEGLARLTEAGVLREITGGRRGRIWLCDDVMDEVSELEQRIGTRSRPSPRWR